ncbi:hypothetical protein B9Z55_024548 [Caenorhabditis nigoni]|nr:hypothetical protein B9Z55_024548 [Caenorhabditis nigoni]
MTKPAEKPKPMDVTIELDLDDDEWAEMDVLTEDYLDDDMDEFPIDPPLELSDVAFKLPGSVRIKHLSRELKDMLIKQLDVPPAVTMGSWQMVADFLTDCLPFELDITDLNPKEPWKPYENLNAQCVVDALVKVERIDLLWKIKELVFENNHLEQIDENASTSQAPTMPAIPPPTPSNLFPGDNFKKINATNSILVQHFEVSKIEKQNFRWFYDNFKEHLKRPEANGMRAVDVADLEQDDGGNLLQMLEHVYPQFKHIVVCFNDSYIKAVKELVPKKKFKFRKFIHDRTVMEFVNNGSKNKRCRCLVMPQTELKVETLWANVTYSFYFPDNYNEFLKRLFDRNVNVRDMSNTGVHDDLIKPAEARNLVTQ